MFISHTAYIWVYCSIWTCPHHCITSSVSLRLRETLFGRVPKGSDVRILGQHILKIHDRNMPLKVAMWGWVFLIDTRWGRSEFWVTFFVCKPLVINCCLKVVNTPNIYALCLADALFIPVKPLHNHDIVSIHFNHFCCMEICDKLRRDLAMFTYIYLNVDEYC